MQQRLSWCFLVSRQPVGSLLSFFLSLSLILKYKLPSSHMNFFPILDRFALCFSEVYLVSWCKKGSWIPILALWRWISCSFTQNSSNFCEWTNFVKYWSWWMKILTVQLFDCSVSKCCNVFDCCVERHCEQDKETEKAYWDYNFIQGENFSSHVLCFIFFIVLLCNWLQIEVHKKKKKKFNWLYFVDCVGVGVNFDSCDRSNCNFVWNGCYWWIHKLFRRYFLCSVYFGYGYRRDYLCLEITRALPGEEATKKIVWSLHIWLT